MPAAQGSITVRRRPLNGEPGEPGINSVTITLYVRSAATPARPTTTATYNFATAILSGISGWYQAMPEANGLPLWAITAFVSSKTAIVSILAAEWTAPTKIVEDGKPGTPGTPGLPGQDGKFIRYVYKFTELKPATPVTDSLIANGWNNSPDQDALSNIMYTHLRSYNVSSPATDIGKPWTIVNGWFTSPVNQLDSQVSVAKIAFTTTKYMQTVNIMYDVSTEDTYDYLLIGGVDTAVTDSSYSAKIAGIRTGTYQVTAVNAGTHYVEVSYTKDSSSSAGRDNVRAKIDYSPICWVSQAECVFNKIVWDWIPGAWSSPVVFIADSGDTESIFWLTHLENVTPLAPESQPQSDDYVPPLKLSAANSVPWTPGKTFSKGALFYYNGFYYEAISAILASDTTFPTAKTRRLYNWTDNPSGVRTSDRYEWTCKRSRSNGVWGSFSSPGLFARFSEDGTDGQPGLPGQPGTPGEQGLQGCIIRHTDWAIGFQYRNDSALTITGFRYIDLVHLAEDNDPKSWYQATATHNGVTSSAANKPGTTSGGAYWIKANIMSPIYTPLIIADQAYLKFGQGNQFLIQKDNGEITAGLSGSVVGQKIRMWAGSPSPDSAPYRVNEAGKLIASDVEVTGKVAATDLQATGTGRIAGLKISGNSLTNEGFENDAQVIIRKDSKNRFAGIGDVIPSFAGYNAVARFENGETRGTYDFDPNVGLVVSAYGARQAHNNIPLLMSGGGIGGFAICIKRIDANYTFLSVDSYITCYNTSNITVNLPATSSIWIGKMYYIRRMNNFNIAVNSSTNNIDVQGSSVSSISIATRGQVGTFIWDGKYWCYNTY